MNKSLGRGWGGGGETQFTGLKQKALSENQKNVSSEEKCTSFTAHLYGCFFSSGKTFLPWVGESGLQTWEDRSLPHREEAWGSAMEEKQRTLGADQRDPPYL